MAGLRGWGVKEDAVQEISREVRGVLERIPAPAIVLSRQYRILAANDAYRTVYGEGEDFRGRRCHEVSHGYSVPCDLAGESCPLRESLDSGDNSRVLHVHHTPRGEEYVSVEMWPVQDPDSQAVMFFIEILRPSAVASARPAAEGVIGRAPAFRQALSLAERVASSDATVMLLGESGTGKDLLAHTIHRLSNRRSKPFVPVECTGMPRDLLESELFGHAKGAFTGADRMKPGLVEAAEGGTLFLDEIGDLPLAEQVKLLRLIETRRFRRVGATEWLDADFRLICATHRNLQAMVEEGTFREDLYYRLSVFEIEIPPLRDRLDDVVPLVDSMLTRLGLPQTIQLSGEAESLLLNYDYPGNVRELRNIVERAVLLAEDGVIRPEHLPNALRNRMDQPSSPTPAAHDLIPLKDLERTYLARAVAAHTGDRKSLARALGISERALYRKLATLRPDD